MYIFSLKLGITKSMDYNFPVLKTQTRNTKLCIYLYWNLVALR